MAATTATARDMDKALWFLDAHVQEKAQPPV
jgi:hypothetical protein